MNALIELLNLWGGRAIGFAWPMLWQSSLLIAVLFAFDLASRRKVRASIRYALWLVVLLKLLLPPTLALPTSLAWWVRPAAPAAAPPKPELPTTFLVHYSDASPGIVTIPVEPNFAPPPGLSLSSDGWMVLGWAAISFALLAWLLVRWWIVARAVRRATPASSRLREWLISARSTARVSRNVELRVTTRTISPAVCGVFRPVILLPQSLVARLTSEQLRAVLLHELIHLRRGDVWVNCLQALLQIGYWWHPLLWLANARIRRVREEAVDDAVMLALAEDADVYAPTLLEVARLALNRPLASLGLVGILESRSALRQRIERLMDFRPPRRAGLSLVSAGCLFAFAALAVPMERSPLTAEREKAQPATSVPLPEHQGEQRASQARASSASDSAVNASQGADDGRATNTVRGGKGRSRIVEKLNNIPWPNRSYHGATLDDVVRDLNAESKLLDPEGYGTNFIINPTAGLVPSADGTTGLPSLNGEPFDLKSLRITIEPAQRDMRLADVLNAVVAAGRGHIQYAIEDYAVVFSARTVPEAEQLYTRTFKINTNRFYTNLVKLGFLDELPPGQPGPLRGTRDADFMQKVSWAFQFYLNSLGVNLNPSLGKAMYFNDRAGMLLVRATMRELDTLEQAVAQLSKTTPHIQIEARFVEMAQADFRALGFDATSGVSPTKDRFFTNSAGSGPMSHYGILTEPQYRVVLRAWEQRSGLEILSAPRVTTLSGRQAQIQTVDLRTVVTGLHPQALIPPGISSNGDDTSQLYQTSEIRFGPILDVFPQLSEDDYIISMSVVASVPEFLGYAPSSNRVSAYINGRLQKVAVPLPKFRSRELMATANLWDGQTMMLFNPQERVTSTRSDGGVETEEVIGANNKPLVVFVTAKLVDEAGKHVHTEDEMPFARDSIPAQPHDQK
jgi:beta-lactamase regulating signal transducer with metallopeptidase domain/type II secretory pathway component GspD/PulD (secretin)